LEEQDNIGKKSKGTREHEPIIREQGNKTLESKERKHSNSPSSDISAASKSGANFSRHRNPIVALKPQVNAYSVDYCGLEAITVMVFRLFSQGAKMTLFADSAGLKE